MRNRDRYDAFPHAVPFAGWYPGAFWASAPAYGWGWWGGGGGWPHDPPFVAGPRRRPPPPRESPTYGRGGDRAVRRWAERYGYDIEMTVRPRPTGPRYDQRDMRPVRGHRGR